ncbi:MAG: G8 domain-containing protein [Bacteroidota bacterium]
MKLFGLNRLGNYFLVLICIFGIDIGNGQAQNILVVEKDQEYLVKDSVLEVDELIIKGIFRLDDTRNIKLKFSRLVIDGGKCIAGTREHPYQHQLWFEFDSDSSAIEVINNGSMQLCGVSNHNNAPKTSDVANSLMDDTANCSINFSAQSGNSGYIIFEKTSQIQIAGVQFYGMGTESNPAILFQDVSEADSFVKNCVLRESKNTDLELVNSAIEVEGNSIFSKLSSSIRSNSTNNSLFSTFKNNQIYNISGQDSYAVVLQNLGCQFVENQIFVENNTNAIGILTDEKNPLVSLTNNQKLIFNDNRLVNLSKEGQKTNIGLRVNDFGSRNIQRIIGNTIVNFGIGALLQNTNMLVSKSSFSNNTVGCVPGRSYLENVTFSRKNPSTKENSIAVKVTDEYGISAPKIKEVTIQNYATGFQVEGLVSSSNYFKGINYTNTKPISFSTIDPETLVYDWDGSLLGKHKTSEAKPKKEMHAHLAHQNHHGKDAKQDEGKGFILYPKNSFLHHTSDKPIANSESIRFAPKSIIGELTIATGMGLTDPVHEHDGIFNGVRLTNETGIATSLHVKSNKYQLNAISEELYELEFTNTEPLFYDYGFEWEAPTGKSIYLKLPYPHLNPVAMRSFGNQLYSVNDMVALKESAESSFYWDSANGYVYLKMVAQNNFEEMVIYSSNVQTEIELGGRKISMSITTGISGERIYFEYTLPQENQYSKLEVLDYYGNVVELLYDGYLDMFTNKVSINLKNYDFSKNVYRYALTVGDKVHRGPIYIY